MDLSRKARGLVSRFGPAAAFAGLAAVLCGSALLPVYTDEIGWRFQERAGYPPGLDTMYNDLCGPETSARPPLFMMPARHFSALVNGLFPDPLFIRLGGVALALLFAALFWRLAGRAGKGPAQIDLRTVGAALLGMGMLPLLMVMSRPEQPLILSVTGAILVALRGANTQRVAWLNAGMIVLLCVIALSYHLKGVLYAPVFAACILTCARGQGTTVARAAGLAGMVVLTLIAARYWVGRFECPGNTVLAAKYGAQNIASRVLAEQGVGGIGALLGGANPFGYVVLAGPQVRPMSNWVPVGIVGPGLAEAFLVGLKLAWGAALALALLCLEQFCLRERRAALAEPRVLISLALFAVALVWGAAQSIKNVYEAAHILPMLAAAIVLSLSLRGREQGLGPRIARPLAAGLLALALVSEAALAVLYGPALARANARSGPVAGQPLSLSLRDYPSVRGDIDAAMAAAGIARAAPLHKPLVDDTTYLALQRSVLPVHALGVLAIWHDPRVDPAAYLVSRGSSGAVTACAMLTPRLLSVAVRRGDICSVPPEALKAVAAGP